ncbi:MAG: lycopene cyclase domain-containing protein [Chloroflexi bacterium]|nr:MAG: lycopene cyclase domain-containing protein [Chloroflexota bacterium]
MTYAQFLFVFLCLPIALLFVVQRRTLRRADWLALGVTAVIAFVYTTPWDNYLIISEVWSFPEDQVWGITLWYVPLEEYAFYILQTFLTGLFVLWLARRFGTREPG